MNKEYTRGLLEIEHDNDTGPRDDYFIEWINVGPFRHDGDNRVVDCDRLKILWELFDGVPTEKIPALADRNAELIAALKKIADWELPDSGRTWEDGSPMSYSAAFGTNGERDYIKSVARSAIYEKVETFGDAIGDFKP